MRRLRQELNSWLKKLYKNEKKKLTKDDGGNEGAGNRNITKTVVKRRSRKQKHHDG